LHSDGSFSYTPGATYYATDSFAFKANDGQADSNVATIAITITPVNQPPAAQGQTVTVTEDGKVMIQLSGSDKETAVNALTFTITSVPTDGVLLNAGGQVVKVGDTFVGPPALTYEPGIAIDGARTATFSFTVTDTGNDGLPPLTSNVATVSVNITKAVADGTVCVQNGIVRIGGTSASDDIVVTQGKTSLVVTYYAPNGLVVSSTTVALAGLTEVRVWGRGGNDQIDLSGISLPSFISGGAGDDTLTGGSGSNVILGGSGQDTIKGGSGNDVLIGGADTDHINGSSGQDILVGGEIAATLTLDNLHQASTDWVKSGLNDVLTPALITDGSYDMLMGGSGLKLFFASVSDKLNKSKGDVVVIV
jgi:Ca2+-binding RTX toxin-like protein